MAAQLTRADLVALEAAQVRALEVLEAVISDRSITAANRARARELLPDTQRNLRRLRELLICHPPTVAELTAKVGDGG